MISSPLLRQSLAACGTVFIFISCGYMMGILSMAIPKLREDDSKIKLNLDEESWIWSISMLSMFPTQVICGLFAFRYGRKPIIVLSSIPGLISCILLFKASNYATIQIACLISGMNGGGVVFGVMYIAEVTSPKYRNVFLNIKTAGMNIGVLLAHTLGNIYDWRDLILSGVSFSIITFLAALSCPESPPWLASKGRFEECTQAFRWFRGKNEEEELEKLIKIKKIEFAEKHTNKINASNKIKVFFNMILDRAFLKALSIILACVVIIDLNGKVVFGAYVIDTLTTILGDQKHAFYGVIGMDVVDLIALAISCIAVKTCNMKKTLFKCSYAAIVSLLLFCILSYLFAHDTISVRFRWVSLVFIVIYFAFLSIGIVPTLLSVTSEVVPMSHRELASSVSGFAFVAILFGSTKITPYLIALFDLHGTFLITAAIMISAILYLRLNMPETQNKTLQDIEIEMKGNFNSDAVKTSLLDNTI